jgi:thiamine-phosphate pyrophosphorylase
MVRFREKNSSSREFFPGVLCVGCLLKKRLKLYGVPLIINDRLDIALACDAEGLHIGQSDIPYKVARKLFGKDKIIGLSVESVQDALEANDTDVDYIGISPVFGTPTKTDTAPPLGLEGVRTSVNFRHPSIATGGINRTNAAEIIEDRSGCEWNISCAGNRVGCISRTSSRTQAYDRQDRIIRKVLKK